ncbi:AraC family transcriptional regulator [Pseudobutyrivibrio sp. MD2005]|uniref:AraC family transcriptional regulator n=1 Tax=Pseudobutyrivibrio sp. MD2005 TaxID=1410616 RepID=UPI000487750E|nr:AraC family transcriptional regulator [Pseudobutyrivibrio sp. MD2005]
MRKDIFDLLNGITEEEKSILKGDASIQKELYTSEDEFVVDSGKLLAQGKLIDIRPHTRFAYFPTHRHNYIEMVCMLKGELTTHFVEGETVRLTAGDVLLLNRHARHDIEPCSENDLAINFIILPEFFSRTQIFYDRNDILRDFIVSSLSDRKNHNDYLLYHAQGLLTVENLIENLIWTLTYHKNDMNTIAMSTMDLLLMNLCTLSSDTLTDMSRGSNTITIQALEYIDTHFDRGTLEELASITGYSTAYLSRLLKQNTGLNFKQLLQQRRLQEAAYLLENTTLTTEKIIKKIGYENSAYFYRIFEAKYGCSPKDYRNG